MKRLSKMKTKIISSLNYFSFVVAVLLNNMNQKEKIRPLGGGWDEKWMGMLLHSLSPGRNRLEETVSPISPCFHPYVLPILAVCAADGSAAKKDLCHARETDLELDEASVGWSSLRFTRNQIHRCDM